MGRMTIGRLGQSLVMETENLEFCEGCGAPLEQCECEHVIFEIVDAYCRFCWPMDCGCFL
jgi:predicted amidophosphoribosyltransferase